MNITGEKMSVLKLETIEKSFGTRQVLKGVSLCINKGETVSVIGPSGGGKSTLLRCGALLEFADRGSISFGEGKGEHKEEIFACKDNGQKSLYLKRKDLARCRAKLGMVFQGFELFPHRSLIQNITDAPIAVQKRQKDEVYAQAEELMGFVGLSGRGDALPYQLSGGEKQRVCIARAMCMNPEILLFDEPTSALDPQSTRDVMALMASLKKRGVTMLVVTHEMEFAKAASDRVIFLHDGKIAVEGAPKEFFANTSNSALSTFLTAGQE